MQEGIKNQIKWLSIKVRFMSLWTISFSSADSCCCSESSKLAPSNTYTKVSIIKTMELPKLKQCCQKLGLAPPNSAAVVNLIRIPLNTQLSSETRVFSFNQDNRCSQLTIPIRNRMQQSQVTVIFVGHPKSWLDNLYSSGTGTGLGKWSVVCRQTQLGRGYSGIDYVKRPWAILQLSFP